MKRKYIELIIQTLFILAFIFLFYILLSNYSFFTTHPCDICEENQGKRCVAKTIYPWDRGISKSLEKIPLDQVSEGN